ncbi:hypothetical protein CKM354_001200100 [Cercospora kikuchii]|uniref:Uncharacterized protein n=1 Tax=Cercospora kikuchii TaxID=84275 RepID=A0A9P3D103_9PEZI|nr:uncharacterized protein CKM354_001200100 [Cercospora kikuchii]GIZ48958.1 hypothetical protein CKM354_001200100 [Cercospora kikuchii]
MSSFPLSPLDAQTDLALAMSDLSVLYKQRNELLTIAKADKCTSYILSVIPEINLTGWGNADTWTETEQKAKTEALQYSIEQAKLEIEILKVVARMRDVRSTMENYYNSLQPRVEMPDQKWVAGIQGLLGRAGQFGVEERRKLLDKIAESAEQLERVAREKGFQVGSGGR